MKKALNKFAFWMAFGVLFLGAVAVAQTQQAVVKIICDKDGQEIYLDGEFKTTCDSGEPVRVIVPSGKHVVEAKRVNDDGSFFYFKKEFKIGGGVQKVIEVESEIGYTPEYYQKRCDSGSIDGCFFYLQNAEKKEPYWETAKLKYFELLCDKGSVRGCAYLHGIGKLSADEFREAADRRLTELYAKDPNAKSELAKELLKYKVYLVDPEFYTHDVDYVREGEDDTERLGKFMIALFTGAYYAPVALYLDEDSGQAYYLLEVMGMPGGNVSPNLNDPEEAPATLVVALSDGSTYKAAVAVEPKGKLGEYKTVLIAGRLEAEFAKRLPAQAHNLALKSAAGSELASAENVVFAGVATYSEDYLYRATRADDPAIYWAYLQLYPNGKYAQEVERGLDELFWAKCDTIEGCQVYLMAVGQEPWAMHVAEAKQKIKEIESAKEKAAYEACKEADDVAPCNAYLEKYPEGQYAALVQLKINDIKRAEEKAAYEACKNASEPTPCLQYLNKYPNGAYKQLVASRFMELSCGAGSARACLEQGRQEAAQRNLKAGLLDVIEPYQLRQKEVARMKFGDRVYPPTFSSDGRYLAAGGEDARLRVYRTADWEEVARKGFGGRVWPPTFSPDGRYLVAGSDDNTLRVYRTTDWEEVARKEFGNTVYFPTFSPDGRYLAVGSGDHTLRVYRTADWQEMARKEFGDYVYSPAFSPDGRYLAVGSYDSTLRVYRTTDWEEVARKEFGNTVYSPAFSPDGRYLAVGSKDRTLRVYRTTDWQEVARKEFGNMVYSSTFSPDGRYLAAGTGSDDRTLRVYRTTDWQEVARKEFGGTVSSTFSPDGRYLAAGSKGTLRVYRTTDWQEVARKEFGDYVYSPTFSPDGRYLAAGSVDRTLRVYRMPLSLDAFTIYAAARSVPARAEGLVFTPLALFSSGEENYYLVEVANESLKVRSRNLPTIQLYDQSGAPISGKLSPLGGDNLMLEPAGFAYFAFKLPNEVAEAVAQRIHNVKFTLPDGRETEAKYVIFSKKVQ